MIRVNKKAVEMPVVMFVILMVVLGLSVLGLFLINNAKFESLISDAKFVDSVYSKESEIRYSLETKIESALLESYKKSAENGILSDDSLLNGIKEKINADYMQKEANEIILNGNYELTINNDLLVFSSEEINMQAKLVNGGDELAKVVYNPRINISINLTEFGLHSFREINRNLNECKSMVIVENATKCLNQGLSNFNVSYSYEKKVFLLETKKKFAVKGSFEKMRAEIKL